MRLEAMNETFTERYIYKKANLPQSPGVSHLPHRPCPPDPE